MLPNDSVTPRSARRRIVKAIAGAVLAFALIQSVTITPAIGGRVINKRTGEPVPGAAIAAVWKLEIFNPLHSALPGGPVKIAETVADSQGYFTLSTAVIVHWPLLPFSWFTRSERYMPQLVVVRDGYQARVANNDIFGIEGPRHGSGFLSVRSSSLENGRVRLVPLPPAPDAEATRQFNFRLTEAIMETAEATAQCRRRIWCQEQPLRRTHDMLVRSRLDKEEP